MNIKLTRPNQMSQEPKLFRIVRLKKGYALNHQKPSNKLSTHFLKTVESCQEASSLLPSLNCRIPPDGTRSSTSKVKSPTYQSAQHSAMINASAPEINTSALNPDSTPQTTLKSSTLPPLSQVSQNGNDMLMRRWSGAEPKDQQPFPNSEDVRGASCQMRCPEENKEIVNDQSFIVSPCTVSNNVYTLQECGNKVVTKNQQKFSLKITSYLLVSSEQHFHQIIKKLS